MKPKRKLTPIEPESARWERIANSLARDFAPSIQPCKQCNYPVISGYCCTFCGSGTP